MQPVKKGQLSAPSAAFRTKSSAILSPENLLFLATMLLFGYCFFYVSLPFMLRQHAARLATGVSQSQPR